MEVERSSYKVLVADDDATMRGLVEQVLSEAGYRVQVAQDGGQALIMAKDRPFDIILADINMPVLTGVELLKECRALQPNIQFIIMTAQGTMETAIQATRYGAFDYLLKPFENLDSLVALVDKAASQLMKVKEKDELLRLMMDKTRTLIKELQGVAYLVVDDGYAERRVKLGQEKETIGTGNEATIRVNNPDILPIHAVVYFEKNGWHLMCKGPASFNDAPLTAPLKLFDQALVHLGSVKVHFVEKRSTFSGEKAVKGLEKVLQEEAQTKAFKLSGTLEEIALADLVQMISMMKKSGVLTIAHRDLPGRIYFSDGAIIHIVLGKATNEKALFRLMVRGQGNFELEPGNVKLSEDQQQLKDPTDMIILDTLRQYDEYRHLGGQVPAGSLRLAVNRNWANRLANMTPRESLVMKAVFRYNYVGLVLDQVPLPDLEIIKTLIELREKGALLVLQ